MDDYKICDCGSGKIELQCCGDKPSKKEKEEIISKELFSEVLDDKTVYNIEIYPRVVRYDRIEIEDIVVPNCQINIHELAHKCKEWAWNNGYAIEISMIDITDWSINVENLDTGKYCYKKTKYNISEPEFIFKACQWILENKEK